MQITTGANRYLLSGAVEFIYDGTNWIIIGGSNNSTLFVTFDYSSGRYTSDKTYSEIENALLAGKCVIGKRPNNNKLYYVTDWSVNSSIMFKCTYYDGSVLYTYYYNVTPSSVNFSYNSYYPQQIYNHASCFDIVYEQSQNKYVVDNYVGDGAWINDYLEYTGHQYSCFARLLSGNINYNTNEWNVGGDSSANYYYEDSELFYLDTVDYDPNYEYDAYDDGSSYYGAVILRFNNSDNSKSIVINYGQELSDSYRCDVTVTTGGAGGTYYGTCDTAANVAAKVVACPSFTTLQEGATVRVKFTYANTVSYQMMSPSDIYATLNVNNTGAKPIMLYGSTYASAYLTGSWAAGSIITFTYNGSSWVLNDYHNNRISYSSGTGLATSFEEDENNIRTIIFNHSSSVTAQNTQAVYPIKINSTGHITGYGSAVQPLPAAPSTNGTYILKCVVSNGTPTYSWEEMQQGSGVQF